MPTLVLECTQDVIAPREVGAFVHAGGSRLHADHPGRHRTLPPPFRAGSHQRGDHRVPGAFAMMCPAEQQPGSKDVGDDQDGQSATAVFAALLEDSAEELYDNAPCGYLSTLMDGTIAKINATLLEWLGLDRAAVVGRMRFTDLLTVGGKLYHETHFAPLLRMQGHIGGIALDIKAADNSRIPVLVSSVVKCGSTGEPQLIRTTLFDARDRRAYEEELLRRRKVADALREQAEADRARLQDALAVLQQSLLPDTLPQIPGMETAAHYHTASPDELGGDFYDVFPSTADAGPSSSATCAARAPKPPPSPH